MPNPPPPADLLKKWLPCLGCGKRMWTDRCHRFCKRCKARVAATPVSSRVPVRLSAGALAVLEGPREDWRDDWRPMP